MVWTKLAVSVRSIGSSTCLSEVRRRVNFVLVVRAVAVLQLDLLLVDPALVLGRRRPSVCKLIAQSLTARHLIIQRLPHRVDRLLHCLLEYFVCLIDI